jgi:predicted nucleotidyltransferase
MRKLSSPSVKITYFDKERVRQALDSYVAALVAGHPEIERVVLFGSMARGGTVPGSDVDLMLVLSTSDEPFLDRVPVYTPDRFPVGIDVFPYTQTEIRSMLEEGNFFVRRALEEGVTLFERSHLA